MPPSETIQEAIRAMVPKVYPTNRALAVAAGITETTLYNILDGKDPSAITLGKLAKAGVRITQRLIESLDNTG